MKKQFAWILTHKLLTTLACGVLAVSGAAAFQAYHRATPPPAAEREAAEPHIPQKSPVPRPLTQDPTAKDQDKQQSSGPVTKNQARTPVTPSQTTAPAPSNTTSPAPSPPPSGQPAIPPAPTGPQPTGVPGSWTLAFEDTFDGSSLDLGKWQPNWLAGNNTAITVPVNSHEDSCYDPAQVTVAGGNLLLRATAITPGSRPGCKKRDGNDAAYASGLVNTYHDYRFTYGFMEARMQLPVSGATFLNWPAFWANGTGSWPTTGEIDVMEAYGGKLSWHFHYALSGTHHEYGDDVTVGNPGDWHTFAAHWQPGKITYYYDGAPVGSVTQNVTAAPMYLILNHAVSASLASPITVPRDVKVDYVRVWQ